MTNYHKSCLICSSKNLKEEASFLNGNMLQCKDCNFYFAKEIPSIETLIKHYETYGRNDFLSPITVKRYHEILDKFEPFRKTNNLIDVGCGIGYFAEEAKKRGWNVYGTEYTDIAIDICSKKGILMHQGKLNPDNYSNIEFDIITSFEVLEHINNPLEEIQNFHKILRKGGALYLTTPNFNSLSRLKSGPKWTVIDYPEHLSYYTPSTLHTLLSKFGFSKIEVLTTGYSITRHKIANQDLKNVKYIDANNDDELLRNKMETVWYWRMIKTTLNAILSTLKIGDAMKVFYIKQ